MSSARIVHELSCGVLAGHRGHVIVLKVYMDESGTHDGSPVITVGAYLARPRQWAEWTKKWNVQKRPIKIFHANDCANFHGEFDGWKERDRDDFVKALLPVIGHSDMAGFVIGIRLNDFFEVAKKYPKILELIPTPYAACFQWVVQDILRWLKSHGDTQRLAFYHENNDYHGEAMSCFNWVKSTEVGTRVMGLAFGTKGDYVPLQAADILAYEGNKRFRNVNKVSRRAWNAINPTGGSRNVRYFDKPALLKWAENGFGRLI